jgi:hypothetical protein
VNYMNISGARDSVLSDNAYSLSLESQRLVTPPTHRISDSADLRHQLHEFQALFQDLVGIRYSYEREMNSSVQLGRSANIDPIRERLESVWHKLCVRSGLPGGERTVPPLPRDSHELLRAPGSSFDQLVINSAAPSMHGGLRTNTDFRQSGQLAIERPPSLQPRPRPPSTYASSLAPSSSGYATTSRETSSLFDLSVITPRTTPYLGGVPSVRTVSDCQLPRPAISTLPPSIATM